MLVFISNAKQIPIVIVKSNLSRLFKSDDLFVQIFRMTEYNIQPKRKN